MKNTMIISAARFASLTLAGIFAGFLVSVLVVELSLRDFDRFVYTQFRHVELVRLDDLATVTLIPAMIGAVFLVVASARQAGPMRWLTLAAVLMFVVVLVTTLAVNLPINADQLTWDVQAPPADWASVRDRWQVAHAVRTGAAVVAFASLAVAAMSASASTRGAAQVRPSHSWASTRL